MGRVNTLNGAKLNKYKLVYRVKEWRYREEYRKVEMTSM